MYEIENMIKIIIKISRENINLKMIEKADKPLQKDKTQLMCCTISQSKFHVIQRSKHKKNEIL